MTKKSWAFSDLVAAISAALHKTFVRSKYANRVSQFLLYYKDFVRQLKPFPPSFCHFCACKMSPGWGHLITWMDPSVGHLNGILARVGGNLNKKFQKSQMPGGLPGGGHVEASIWPIHQPVWQGEGFFPISFPPFCASSTQAIKVSHACIDLSSGHGVSIYNFGQDLYW